MKAVLGAMLLVLLTPRFGNCDEPVSLSLFFGFTEIYGSESQVDLLDDLNIRYEEETEQLETTIREAELKLKEKKKKHESECLEILNEKQRQELKSAQLEEAINKLKERSKVDKQYLEQMENILPIIGNATTVELYEGLKRTGMNTFVMPQPDEATFEVQSYTFYKTKRKIDALEAIVLQDICSDYRSFAGYRGGKLCGGFHPDALIRFHGPDG